MDEKARESNLPPMGYGRNLKNPIECAPKRENTLFRIKDSVNFFFALRPCGPILSVLRERMKSAHRGEL